MAHEQYKELMAAQALSALDHDEAQALESHLATCAECRSEMDEWQNTASWLALNAPQLEPSPRVREKILLRIKTEPAPAKRSSGTVVEMPVRTRQVASTTQRWGAIAAMLLFAALLLPLLLLWRQNGAYNSQVAEISRQLAETKQQLASAEEKVSIVSSPGARITELGGTDVAPAARGTVAYDQSGRAVLFTKDLPPPPSGKAYQLWFITGGKPMPGKVFKTTAAGEGTLSDRIPTQALNASIFAVTLEPEAGVTQPTGQIYLKSGS
jgi:anti-sigma-K factor RskA